MKKTFGDVCREWRKQQRYSQLRLSVELGVSSKHISFIETGRASPSREMILKIGAFLCLPKREINRGLSAAGYAPVYTDLPYEHEDLKPVFSAVEHMLANHMPYPAIVLNQHWDVVQANVAAQQLFFRIGFAQHNNLIEALLDDDPATSSILNWRESMQALLVRLRHEISVFGCSEKLFELEKKLAAHVERAGGDLTVNHDQAVLSIELQVDDKALSFFSIIAQLGTVQDVAVSEFKVELMFPSDANTERFYNS